MCNLYSFTSAQDAARQHFKVSASRDHLGNFEPLLAIWPKYSAPVVRLNSDNDREMIAMSWGFLTAQTSKKTGKSLAPAAWNNARDDKVQKSGLWKESFHERRCLVPASSFREAKGRRPAIDFWFALSGDEPRPLFAFAGLWRGFQPGLPDDMADTLTHTIVTTSANEIVQPVHPTRMPVILDPSDYEQWLTGTFDEAFELVRPFPADQMQVVAEGIGLRTDEGKSIRAT